MIFPRLRFFLPAKRLAISASPQRRNGAEQEKVAGARPQPRSHIRACGALPERSTQAPVPLKPSLPTVPSAPESVRWFNDEVHAHDSQLKAYLRGSFPTVHDIDDVVQESYLRIWKARAAKPIQSAKAFLFRVAYNVAIDLVRRHRVSPIEAVDDLGELPISGSACDAAQANAAGERIDGLVAALGCLPRRSREIVILCKLEGHSYREVATQLGISEKTVAEHLYRGIQRLGEELQRRGLDPFDP